jgi:short-subunit dehydrogenase
LPDSGWRSALVTGASSGIGEAFVRRLAAEGVATVVVARRVDRLEALAASLPGIEVLPADLTTDEGVARVKARLGSVDQPIDLLINNAGFGTSGRFASIDPQRSDDEIGLNVLALTRLSRAALPGMIERRRGWVLNVSSVVAFAALPTLAVYAATKAYVTSFTEALHEELRGSGVVVTVLHPGLTRTEFTAVSSGEVAGTSARSFATMEADEVAAVGLHALAAGRASVAAGWPNKVIVALSPLVPRAVVRRIVAVTRRHH